jgi:outer membrane protein OmpA-like peptidoglycan-associated protein
MKQRDIFFTGLLLASSSLGLLACASKPQPNAALTDAQQAYASASSNPQAQAAAPGELQNAEESLHEATTAWKDNKDPATVDHYAYMARRYSEVAEEAAKVRTAAIQTTTTARVLTLGDMLFATGKADLNAQGHKAVADLAVFMRNYPDRTMAIVGYTDSTGSAALNARLSQARADTVRNALVAQGIDASRIEASGRGPANPVASNTTKSGRQQNRRVEVDISGSQRTIGAGTSTSQ